MISAIVLINAKVDRIPEVAQAIAELEGVSEVYSVAGDADLIALVDRLARRLRAAHRVCRTVVLRLRFDDFSRATRSCIRGLCSMAVARSAVASAPEFGLENE